MELKDVAPIVAATVSGFAAIACVVMTWRLTRLSTDRNDKSVRRKDAREEMKNLSVNTFKLFESAIRIIKAGDDFDLHDEFSENNAKVVLLMPERVTEQYHRAAHALEKWSFLHAKASPRRMKVGDETLIMLQAPDPTEKYREPASQALEKLQEDVRELVRLMRAEIDALRDKRP